VRLLVGLISLRDADVPLETSVAATLEHFA
jgi:hypothetical protein